MRDTTVTLHKELHMQVGTLVQSIGRAHWYGVVCQSGTNRIKVLPVLTKKGQLQRKPRLRTLTVQEVRISSLPILDDLSEKIRELIYQRCMYY